MNTSDGPLPEMLTCNFAPSRRDIVCMVWTILLESWLQLLRPEIVIASVRLAVGSGVIAPRDRHSLLQKLALLELRARAALFATGS